MLQQWHCRLKKDVSWQEEHSNQRQRSFCAFYRKALNFYRKHPVGPLDEPNPISKVNLMVGVYWSGLQALVCPSLSFLHHLSTSFASHCASTGTSRRNCRKLGMHFKKWFGKHGSFLKSSRVLLQSSNSSSIISIPASQPKFIMSSHASTCKKPWGKNP